MEYFDVSIILCVYLQGLQNAMASIIHVCKTRWEIVYIQYARIADYWNLLKVPHSAVCALNVREYERHIVVHFEGQLSREFLPIYI